MTENTSERINRNTSGTSNTRRKWNKDITTIYLPILEEANKEEANKDNAFLEEANLEDVNETKKEYTITYNTSIISKISKWRLKTRKYKYTNIIKKTKKHFD